MIQQAWTVMIKDRQATISLEDLDLTHLAVHFGEIKNLITQLPQSKTFKTFSMSSRISSR